MPTSFIGNQDFVIKCFIFCNIKFLAVFLNSFDFPSKTKLYYIKDAGLSISVGPVKQHHICCLHILYIMKFRGKKFKIFCFYFLYFHFLLSFEQFDILIRQSIQPSIEFIFIFYLLFQLLHNTLNLLFVYTMTFHFLLNKTLDCTILLLIPHLIRLKS